MEDVIEDEELIFDGNAVEKLCNDTLNSLLGDTLYNQKKIDEWTNKIIESVLHGLQGTNKPYKLYFLLHYTFCVFLNFLVTANKNQKLNKKIKKGMW